MAGWGEEPGLIGRLNEVTGDGLQGSGKQDLVLGSWRLGVEPSAHLSSSQSKAEHGHKVRLAVGSGLRPDTWERFVRRFGPLQVLETYGLTEGNVATFNYTGQLGAVGRASWLYKVREEWERNWGSHERWGLAGRGLMQLK